MANLKKIVFIIPYRGIGDIIFHIPFSYLFLKSTIQDFLLSPTNLTKRIF